MRQYIPRTYQKHTNMYQYIPICTKAPCICALKWQTGCSAPHLHVEMSQIFLQMIQSVSRLAHDNNLVPSNGGAGPPGMHISFMNALMLANDFTACCFTVAIGAWMAWVQFILRAPERRNGINVSQM